MLPFFTDTNINPLCASKISMWLVSNSSVVWTLKISTCLLTWQQIGVQPWSTTPSVPSMYCIAIASSHWLKLHHYMNTLLPLKRIIDPHNFCPLLLILKLGRWSVVITEYYCSRLICVCSYKLLVSFSQADFFLFFREFHFRSYFVSNDWVYVILSS